MSKDYDELRHKIDVIEREKERKDGYVAGVKDAFKHAIFVCGLLWSFIMLMVNLFGDFAYNHVPMVRQIVDIVNGAK